MFCPHRPCGFVGAYCMPLFRSTSCLAPLGGCAFLALWVVSCSAFCLSPFVCVSVVCSSLLACLPLLCTCLLCGLCVLPPLHLDSLLCGLWYLWSPPSLGCFRVASWPSNFLFYWSLPLGIWLLLATAWLPCLIAWSVVVLCFLASFCSRQQRPLALCGVFDYLYTMGHMLLWALRSSQRYSSS